MHAMALCCAVLLSQAATPNSAAFFKGLEDALAKDASLLSLHRGFVAYLQAHPDTLAAERAWWDVDIQPTMAQASARMDEALLGDAAAASALDTAYDLLARDEALRGRVESLQRIEFTQGDAEGLLSQGLNALRANPDLAMQLLGGGEDLTGLAGPLRTLAGMLAQRPGLNDELGGIFRGLNESPLARTRLFPWWQTLAQNPGAAAAYGGMAQQFVQSPGRFWAWHARELAWATDAQARDWMRYLYRRTRRNPALAGAYEHYLRAVFEQPERIAAAERRFDEPVLVDFPPKPAPPRLAPMAAPTEEALKPGVTRPHVEKPDTTARPLPHAPAEPVRPAMPSLPRVEMRKAAPRATK